VVTRIKTLIYFVASDMLAKMNLDNPIGERTMRQVTISVAMVVFATLLASAPATAVENWGPKQNGGQCFNVARGEGKDLQFGHWGACPQPASAASNTAAPARRTARRAAR
jgi:hypothetical protein